MVYIFLFLEIPFVTKILKQKKNNNTDIIIYIFLEIPLEIIIYK